MKKDIKEQNDLPYIVSLVKVVSLFQKLNVVMKINL